MVLGPVDEDLALAFDLFHLRDDLLRRLLLEQLGDRFGERFSRLVVDFGVEGNVDLQSLRARGLGEALNPEVAEHLPQPQRHPAAAHFRAQTSAAMQAMCGIDTPVAGLREIHSPAVI